MGPGFYGMTNWSPSPKVVFLALIPTFLKARKSTKMWGSIYTWQYVMGCILAFLQSGVEISDFGYH